MQQRRFLFLLFFLFTLNLFSQVIGNVNNSKGEALSFVNIYIEGTYSGTTSNDDGEYELNLSTLGTYTMVFKYLGYKTLKKTITIDKFPFTLNVSLVEEKVSLDQVVIKANENPANRIMRMAIANRKSNLEKIKAFKADFYSKGLIRIENAPEKILGQDIGDLGGGLDSTRTGILYLSETLSKIQFERPDKLKEEITASKVSGNDNGFSFNNATDVDFNFYNNTIDLGSQLVSPISDFAFNYYRYELDGVFYDDLGNLINKIKVIPRRENDRVFSGIIYIVEDQWSLYATELSTTGQQSQIEAVDTILLKQNYTYSEEDKHWVIISQSIDFVYGIFGIKGDGRFTAGYSNYDFNPKFEAKDFGRELLSFTDEANKKDSIFWKNIRPVPLTTEEITDYVRKDSIQVIRKSKKYLDSIDARTNKFNVSNLLFGYNYSNSYKDWNLGFRSLLSSVGFNTVQGFTGNLDMYYRKNIDEFRKYFSLNARVNYGIDDQRLRISGSATYKFNNVSRPFLTVSGGVRTEQFNGTQPISPLINTISTLFFEDNYMKIYDRAFAQIAYSHEWFNGFRWASSLSYERRNPLFNISDYVLIGQDTDFYTSNNPINEMGFGIAPFVTHNILKLNISGRIRFGQNYFSYPGSKANITNNDYPSLYLGYEKGFGSTNSNYNYDQLKLRLTQRIDLSNKGQFAYNIRAGKFFNADNIAFMDYQHFNGNLTHIGRSGNYLNVFNNLPYYAMSTNDAYAEFHAEHDFRGYILGKIPVLNKLNYNLIIGAHALSIPNYKPYQEYSIGIDNIGIKKFKFLRLDYVRSYQGGFRSDAVIFGLKFLNIID